ncbi:MAG TPA: Gfo/Idh/MocA family oxidoreductase [Candidatus Tectomicrobia bacterium]|jgi:predicted dehydrogenase
MKLALCIVGCGQFARTFVQGLQPLRGDIDLFFASRDLERARTYAAMFQGCGAFGSYEAAAADSRVEAMYVCTPHYLHQVHVALAAQAGKHILVEKPIARTLAEGQAIIAAARRAGVTLMVAENYRFMAVVRQCKTLIEQGSVGKLRLVQQQEEAPFQPGQWRGSRNLNGGGVFIDGGIHKVHLLRYLAGEPEHIYAAALPQALDQHEGEDGVVLMTRGAGGVVGLIHHAWTNSQRAAPPWVVVSGTRGRIYFEVGASWLRLEQGSAARTLQCAADANGLTPMVQAFRDSIRDGREPEMSGAEGLLDLAVVLKAYEAMEQGVTLALQRPPVGAGGAV